MNRILIIDHDPAFSETITDLLKHEGFAVISMQDGIEGLQQVLGSEAGYDLILLDTLLPGMNGFEVLEHIRSKSDTPVILLADPSQRTLQSTGLELGADDFLIKPCNPRELLARIRAILRRTKIYIRNEVMPAAGKIVLGDIELDAGTRVVRRNGEKLQLTSTEFNFLQIMIRSAGHIVSREHLALSVLGHELSAGDGVAVTDENALPAHATVPSEVLLFDLGLRALDRPGHHLGLDRHVVGQVQPVEHRLQRGAVEPAHELVAQRQVKA